MTTAIVDDRKRIRIPDAKPGQVVLVETKADGWRLTPVKPASPEIPTIIAKLVKNGDDLGFELPKGYQLDPDAIVQAIREERDNR